jgi:hypothetical protein
MAKQADIEKPISLMRPANAKTVQKILDRANKASAAESKAVVRNAAKITSGLSRGGGKLSKTLGLALAFHGRATKGAASMRQKAPDTNGRSFHYSHSTVGRTDGRKGSASAGGGGGSAGPSGGTTAPSAATSGTGGRGKAKPATREAAHQAYVERDSAVASERGAGVDEVGAGRGAGVGRSGQGREREIDDEGREPGQGREPGRERKARTAHEIEVDQEKVMEAVAGMLPSAHVGSATAAQEYVEDERKVDGRFGHANSFGTIGETYEERLKFWDLVAEHERDPEARTQRRLVLELPHEASATARQEIVKQFCSWFEDNGVPYWAAIHAPGKDNDDRNFHAHVVYADRPAKQMVDPETGKLAWDFAITKTYKTSSRNTKTSHPYRQKKMPEMRDINFVKKDRARFAKVVNEVLAKTNCKVRYDPRSYKEMGLDVEPMKAVSRIVADKMKSKDFVAMDAEWTRRMVQQEMAAAAVARDKTLQRLNKVEKQLREATKDIRTPAKANAKLPPNMKVGKDSTLTQRAADAIVSHILRNERDRLAEQFVRESTRRAIVHVLEATSPKSARRKGADRQVYSKAGETPDLAGLAALHAAATIELQEFDHATRGWKRKTGDAARHAYDLWQRSANPSRYKPKATAPAMPVAMPAEPSAPKPMAAAPAMQPSNGYQPAEATTASVVLPATMPFVPQPTEPAKAPRTMDFTGQAAARLAQPSLATPGIAPFVPWRQATDEPDRQPTYEETFESVMGPPDSAARRIHAFLQAQMATLNRLKEAGIIKVLDAETMDMFIQAVRRSYAKTPEQAAEAGPAPRAPEPVPAPGPQATVAQDGPAVVPAQATPAAATKSPPELSQAPPARPVEATVSVTPTPTPRPPVATDLPTARPTNTTPPALPEKTPPASAEASRPRAREPMARRDAVPGARPPAAAVVRTERPAAERATQASTPTEPTAKPVQPTEASRPTPPGRLSDPRIDAATPAAPLRQQPAKTEDQPGLPLTAGAGERPARSDSTPAPAARPTDAASLPAARPKQPSRLRRPVVEVPTAQDAPGGLFDEMGLFEKAYQAQDSTKAAGRTRSVPETLSKDAAMETERVEDERPKKKSMEAKKKRRRAILSQVIQPDYFGR